MLYGAPDTHPGILTDMGHKYASERKLPRRDERTHAAPEASPHRARKDTKRWCRGKVGVEHTPNVVLAAAGWQRFGGWEKRCGWSSWKPAGWMCRHQEVCSECGRIMREAFGKDCPNYPSSMGVSHT